MNIFNGFRSTEIQHDDASLGTVDNVYHVCIPHVCKIVKMNCAIFMIPRPPNTLKIPISPSIMYRSISPLFSASSLSGEEAHSMRWCRCVESCSCEATEDVPAPQRQ